MNFAECSHPGRFVPLLMFFLLHIFAFFFVFIAHFACQYCSRGAGWRNFAATPDFQPEPEADTSRELQPNLNLSLSANDEMKTLLKMNDKTIREVGPQI